VVILYTSSLRLDVLPAHRVGRFVCPDVARHDRAAFLVADRLRALPVAVLGIVGGFHAAAAGDGGGPAVRLFGYVALLDTALVRGAATSVALPRRAGGGGHRADAGRLAGKFFTVEKVVTALAILVSFNVLFLGALAIAGRLQRADGWITGPALAMPLSPFAFTAWLLTFRSWARSRASCFPSCSSLICA
jgi:hypothetical protein